MSSSFESWATVPSGRRLETPDKPAGWYGTLGTLERATPAAVEVAVRHFRQLDPESLQQDGKVWTDTGSGERYRLARGSVLAAREPRKQADAFFVTGDHFIVFLRADREEEGELVYLGSVGARRADGRDRA